MKAALVIAALAVCVATAHAQQSAGLPGRFQAVPLTNPSGTSSVLIIDTMTGNIWKWYEGVSTGGSLGGSGIRYEGVEVPGDRPGEIVAREGFGTPPQQRPPAGK